LNRVSAAQRPEAPPIERRRAPRTPVALPVRAREPDGREWESTSVNLSTSGLKIRAAGVTGPGPETALTLTLPDGETRLNVASFLVRADFDGYAFHFLNLSDRQWSQLDELVRQSESIRRLHVEPHLRILHLIGETIGASLDVDEVLRIALDALTQVTGHEISSLHLLSADGTTLHLRGDRGLRPDCGSSFGYCRLVRAPSVALRPAVTRLTWRTPARPSIWGRPTGR